MSQPAPITRTTLRIALAMSKRQLEYEFSKIYAANPAIKKKLRKKRKIPVAIAMKLFPVDKEEIKEAKRIVKERRIQ